MGQVIWKNATLHGGPLDGAEFELDYDPPPEFILVLSQCPTCGSHHHVDARDAAALGPPLDGQEPNLYKLKKWEGLKADYEYGDLASGLPPSEKDKKPTRKRERELQPA